VGIDICAGTSAVSGGLSASAMAPWTAFAAAHMSLTTTEDGSSPSDFVVTFTEDKNGFNIYAKKYGPSDVSMKSVFIGGFHHWRVVNNTHEVQPF
jgi:hypothetical protein